MSCERLDDVDLTVSDWEDHKGVKVVFGIQKEALPTSGAKRPLVIDIMRTSDP